MNPSGMKAAFPQAIENIGRKNDNVVVVVGDIGHFALQGFAKQNPGRYFNLGILEPTLISTCAGLAKEGFIPIGHTIAPFIAERSLEQIKLDFCYQSLPGNLITVGSAFDYTSLGCTHHCYTDLGLLASYPNTEVCYPASPKELISLVEQRYDSPKLSYYRIARNPHKIEFDSVEFGKSILVREGKDITLTATGPQLNNIIKASNFLAEDGIECEVIYTHTIKPYDSLSLINSAKKTGRVFAVEEHVSKGSLISNVLETCCSLDNVRIAYHCIPDIFIRKYGTYDEILKYLNFTPDTYIKKIKELLN